MGSLFNEDELVEIRPRKAEVEKSPPGIHNPIRNPMGAPAIVPKQAPVELLLSPDDAARR